MDTICLYQGQLWEKECFSSHEFYQRPSEIQLEGEERKPNSPEKQLPLRRSGGRTRADGVSQGDPVISFVLYTLLGGAVCGAQAISQIEMTCHIVPVQTNSHTCPNKEQHLGNLAAGPGPYMILHCKGLPSPLHFHRPLCCLLSVETCRAAATSDAPVRPRVCPSPGPSSPAPCLLFRLSFCVCNRPPVRLSVRHSHYISDSYQASSGFLSACETSLAVLSDTVRQTQT